MSGSDGSGVVGLDQFVDGCRRMKGQAIALDRQRILFHMDAVLKGVGTLKAAIGIESQKRIKKAPREVAQAKVHPIMNRCALHNAMVSFQ